MAKILLIETATEVCSVAIACDGTVLALVEEMDQPKHAERLTLLIQQCTREAGLPLATLDAVAVSRGPGSYTSLRVGLSVAKGICYALDKPLIAVDTLKALAAGSLWEYAQSNAEYGMRNTEWMPSHNDGNSAFRIPHSVFAMPMLDARRNEVWTAVYDSNLQLLVPAQPLILENNLLDLFLQQNPEHSPEYVYIVAGNGAKKMEAAGIFENSVFSPVRICSAQNLAVLAEVNFQNGDFQDVSYMNPYYMKDPNITTPNKPLF